ncbi:hypothetical protein BC834DRAFT_900063 [Gloeopeniophorella convolvens]|nr:hypothetical protein BC834DRAFT_900063 [Gloeopeniophorella convolvens]
MLRLASTPLLRSGGAWSLLGSRQLAPHTAGTRFSSNDVPPKNQDIPYARVRVVDPETGKPRPPQRLTDVLANLATTERPRPGGQPKVFVTEFAQLVAPPSDATDGYALVRLINKKDSVAREKEQRLKKAASRRASEEKEVQFAWNIGPGDLEHKIRKAHQDLERGVRVQLIFARKASGGMARDASTKQEQDALVTRVVEALSDVGKEWRVREYRKSMTTVYMQDPKRPIPHKSMLAAKEAAKTTTQS